MSERIKKMLNDILTKVEKSTKLSEYEKVMIIKEIVGILLGLNSERPWIVTTYLKEDKKKGRKK